MGGLLAHSGYLGLDGVIVAAFMGSLSGDQLYFHLGRRHGPALLKKRPSWEARVEKVNEKFKRHHTLLILGFRFVYGIRTMTPFVLGMSRVSVLKFIILNAISAALWAVLIGSGGFVFGRAMEAVLGDIRNYEIGLIAALAAAGTLIWAVRYLRGRSR